MRATIETEEFQYVAGFFKREPRWKVKCKIDFTNEELSIIRARNLGDLQVYTQSIGTGDDIAINLKQVVKHGIWSVFTTPIDARNFEYELETNTLPALKDYLDASAEVEAGPRTLEF